jgi:hypothetical protein
MNDTKTFTNRATTRIQASVLFTELLPRQRLHKPSLITRKSSEIQQNKQYRTKFSLTLLTNNQSQMSNLHVYGQQESVSENRGS